MRTGWLTFHDRKWLTLKRPLTRIKAIFTSGYPEDLIARQGVLEKGLHFIPKPSPINTLLRKIREVLDQ